MIYISFAIAVSINCANYLLVVAENANIPGIPVCFRKFTDLNNFRSLETRISLNVCILRLDNPLEILLTNKAISD